MSPAPSNHRAPAPGFARVAIALGVVALAGPARAETRTVLRVGVEPVALVPAADTPMLGGYVDDAVTAYNAAARAYNGAHDYAPGSTMATDSIDRSAFALHTTLLSIAPTIEAGGDHVYARLEARLGLGDHVRAIGVGVYPLVVAAPMRRGTVVPYLALGGTMAWLDRTDDQGQLGGLLTARVAAGTRVRSLSIELGVGVYALGGVLDRARLDTMTTYDPRGSAPPPAPTTALTGGEGRGVVDLAVGLGW